MIKRGNKGGESVLTPTMVFVIIGIAFLAFILIYGVSFAGKVDKGITTFEPSEIDAQVLSCKVYARASTQSSFCEYREIEKNTYVNCLLGDVKNRLVQENILSENEISQMNCKDKKTFCEGTKKELEGEGEIFNDQITVNGVSCKDLGVAKTTSTDSTTTTD